MTKKINKSEAQLHLIVVIPCSPGGPVMFSEAAERHNQHL